MPRRLGGLLPGRADYLRGPHRGPMPRPWGASGQRGGGGAAGA